MKTKDRIERMIKWYVEDPDVRDLEGLLRDIELTLKKSVVLVQEIDNAGTYVELHESKASAMRSLGRYVRSEWDNHIDRQIPKNTDDAIVDYFHHCDSDGYAIIDL